MDKNYWEDYYKKQNANQKPSFFAKHIYENVVCDRSTLIELGCGNGRDAVYFANKGLKIKAIDQCESEIKFLKHKFSQLKNCHFHTGDFTNLNHDENFDIVYSRFTLHSISAEQEARVCCWAYQVLNKGGVFCIEVRGQKNEIYGKGDIVVNESDAFVYDDHYRRFLNFNDFCLRLKEIGFALEYAEEKKGFAPFNDTDETFIRVIAKK